MRVIDVLLLLRHRSVKRGVCRKKRAPHRVFFDSLQLPALCRARRGKLRKIRVLRDLLIFSGDPLLRILGQLYSPRIQLPGQLVLFFLQLLFVSLRGRFDLHIERFNPALEVVYRLVLSDIALRPRICVFRLSVFPVFIGGVRRQDEIFPPLRLFILPLHLLLRGNLVIFIQPGVIRFEFRYLLHIIPVTFVRLVRHARH